MSDIAQHARQLRRRLGIWIVAATLLAGGTIGWLWLLRGSRILDSDTILIGGWVILGALVLLIALLLHTTPPDALRLPRRVSAAIILTVATMMQVAAIMLLWPALSEDVLRYRLDGGMWLRGVSPFRVPPQQYAGDAVDELAPFAHLHTIYPPVSQALFVAGRWGEERLGSEVPHIPHHSSATSPRQTFAHLPSSSSGANDLASGARRLDPSLPLRDGDRQLPGLDSEVADGQRAIVGASPAALAPPPPAPWRNALPHLSRLHHVLVFRMLFALAAIASTAVLLAILHHSARSPWWATLFAWNPLLVLETGGMGHQDVVGCLFLLGMIYMLQKQRPAAAGVLLALAAGIKPQAAILAPLLLSAGRDAALRAGAAFGATALLVYLPIVAGGLEGWLSTVRMYARTWEFNGSFYELLKFLFGHRDGGDAMLRINSIARALALIGPLLVMLLTWRRRMPPADAAYCIFLAMLLLSPVVYPWYLLWMLCIVPLLRWSVGWSGLVWSATVGMSYVVWHEPAWEVPARWALAQYVPVYAALVVEWVWTRSEIASSSLKFPPAEAGSPNVPA